MKNVITSVMPDSIAEEVGIEVNDILLSVNGEKITDINTIIDNNMFIENTYIVVKRGKKNSYIGKKN